MPKQKYNHKLEHYPPIYGCSFRTIQRYSRAGYPLDDEEATRLLIANQRTSPAVPGAAEAPAAHGNGPRTPAATKTEALGLNAAIQRLQAAEAKAHADYLNAKTDLTAAQKQKQWLALSEQLRKVEQSTPSIEAENAKTIHADELRTVLTEVFTRLRQDLETLPKRIALELVGQDAIGIEQTLKREAEEVVASLFSLKYLGGSGNG